MVPLYFQTCTGRVGERIKNPRKSGIDVDWAGIGLRTTLHRAEMIEAELVYINTSDPEALKGTKLEHI